MANSVIKRTGNTTIIKSPKDDGGWTSANKKILKIVDNGNGFTVKHYSWSDAYPDMYYNIPYDLAGDLYRVFKEIDIENY